MPFAFLFVFPPQLRTCEDYANETDDRIKKTTAVLFVLFTRLGSPYFLHLVFSCSQLVHSPCYLAVSFKQIGKLQKKCPPPQPNIYPKVTQYFLILWMKLYRSWSSWSVCVWTIGDIQPCRLIVSEPLSTEYSLWSMDFFHSWKYRTGSKFRLKCR